MKTSSGICGALSTLLLLLAGCSQSRVGDTRMEDPFALEMVASMRAAEKKRAVSGKSKLPSSGTEALAEKAKDFWAPERALKSLGLSSDRVPSILSQESEAIEWLEAAQRSDLDLMRLAALRHPSVTARIEELSAVSNEYDQIDALAEVVARYQTFTRTSRTASSLPPARGAKAKEAAILPTPSIESLRADLVTHGLEKKWEELREEALSAATRTGRAAAQLRHRTQSAVVAQEHLRLMTKLEKVLQARVGSARSSTADLLVVKSRHAELATGVANLRDTAASFAASLLSSLDLPPMHSFALKPPLAVVMNLEDRDRLLQLTRERSPRLAIKQATSRRLEAALDLASLSSSLPLSFSGASYERGMGGEAGPDRQNGLFRTTPPTGMPSASFAPDQALLLEMRQRLFAAQQDARSTWRELEAEASRAHAARATAGELLQVRRGKTVPLAQSAWESHFGSYRAGQESFLDLYRAAERLIEAKQKVVDAVRDVQIANMDLFHLRALPNR